MGPSRLIDRLSLRYDLAMILVKHGLIYDTTIVLSRLLFQLCLPVLELA